MVWMIHLPKRKWNLSGQALSPGELCFLFNALTTRRGFPKALRR
jgi:hypothetical protein